MLVISDDHDYEQLGFLGLHPNVRTPVLDRLAASGVVFPVAYATPRCRPTLGGLLTGARPRQSGIYANVLERSPTIGQTVASLLRDAEYATFAQGKFWEGDPRRLGFTHGKGRDLEFVRRGQEDVVRFLDAASGGPFFIWWAPMIPHTPHDPPARFEGLFIPDEIQVPSYLPESMRERFRDYEARSLAMVAWLDEEVGKLLAELDRRGLREKTMIIFLIDNGWATALPSKGSPFEKGVRTPLVVSWQGQIAPARVVDRLVSYLDVIPTILDYAGVDVPETLAGRSLRPLLEGEDVPWRDTLFGAAYPRVVRKPPQNEVFALYARTKRWKYVWYPRTLRNDVDFGIFHGFSAFPARLRGSEDLYDLDRDRYELENLSNRPEHFQRLRRFREKVGQWWSSTGGAPFPRAFP